MGRHIKELIDLDAIKIEAIEQWSERKFENIKVLTNNISNVKNLLEHSKAWQELQDIMTAGTSSKESKSNWDYTKFILENSEEVINLANSGLGVKNLKEIYDKDDKLVEVILNKNDKLIPFLKTKELTSEDLKKCNISDIKNLADNKVSAEQLKKELITRPSLTNSPPVGKWTAQIHQERQISKKSPNNSRTT